MRAPGDYVQLAPADQRVAAGTDGVFSSSGRWTLTSASVDFADRGLAAGHVVRLKHSSLAYFGPGQLLAVETVAGHSATLRRRGELAGDGEPPGPAAGLTAVDFLALTLYPQVESASFDLNARFGIDDLLAGSAVADLSNIRELRQVTVLQVLVDRYTDMSRFSADSASGGPIDVFGTKAKKYQAELDARLARLTIHWGSAGADRPSTTRFGTRISR